ncbi:hypothetical protein NDU88_007718 [Pleurodeles waltl]|uniref:Uncharacterized protein n=1 Tax=Pleurodeles waltl TaxID=8319 RepID=A0AAV7P1L5_PLEWA|nr:hypothetical protein NDU88_007718 [Pleurodeles waltl]
MGGRFVKDGENNTIREYIIWHFLVSMTFVGDVQSCQGVGLTSSPVKPRGTKAQCVRRSSPAPGRGALPSVSPAFNGSAAPRGPPGSPISRAPRRSLCTRGSSPHCRCGSRSRLNFEAAPPPRCLRALPGPNVVFVGQPQRTQGPCPHPAAALLYRSPWPPPAAPALPRQRGDPAGDPATPGPSAPAPRRPATLLEATAPTAVLGRRSPLRPAGPGLPKNTLRSRCKGPAAPRASPQLSALARARIGPEMARFFSTFKLAPPERGI